MGQNHKPVCECACVGEWVYMCKYIYVYMWQAHTNNGPFIKISMYAGLLGALSVSKVTPAFFSFLPVKGVQSP